MAVFTEGDLVTIPFPFSDLTATKIRPALVLRALGGDDVILCQITSQFKSDQYSINLRVADLRTGTLKFESRIRPNKLFTASRKIIRQSIGSISPEKYSEVIQNIKSLLRIQ